VGSARTPGAGEEAAVRVVERRFHPFVERQRAAPADTFRQPGRQIRLACY
jgi:hypothetical protein